MWSDHFKKICDQSHPDYPSEGPTPRRLHALRSRDPLDYFHAEPPVGPGTRYPVVQGLLADAGLLKDTGDRPGHRIHPGAYRQPGREVFQSLRIFTTMIDND